MENHEIRDKILIGAEELFMKYGIRSVSMDNIANHLGVSKKTLYQYFTDKDEIVESVTKAHLDEQERQMTGVRDHSKNAIEELVGVSVCLKENMRGMNPSLLFDLQKYHHKAWNLWLKFRDNMVRKSIIANLDQGKQEGYFRADINTEVLATLRLENIQLAFDPSVFPPDRFALAEVQMQVLEHFVYGLFTDKGRKLYEKLKTKSPNLEQILAQI
ncbi:MAG: TetR/AcrR family transcriptional regulator [Cyclobacteriaceae bacterium]